MGKHLQKQKTKGGGLKNEGVFRVDVLTRSIDTYIYAKKCAPVSVFFRRSKTTEQKQQSKNNRAKTTEQKQQYAHFLEL